jgi:hydrogenase maturation factor
LTELVRERCVTCSDEAVEAEVVAVDGPEAIVRVAGAHEHVAIDLVPDAAPGDLLLCHAGIALERLERSRESPQVAQSHYARPAPAGPQATP